MLRSGGGGGCSFDRRINRLDHRGGIAGVVPIIGIGWSGRSIATQQGGDDLTDLTDTQQVGEQREDQHGRDGGDPERQQQRRLRLRPQPKAQQMP